jgi:hypothetical protein
MRTSVARTAGVCLLVACVVGCLGQSGGDSGATRFAAGSSKPPRVLTEHRFRGGADATRAAGEDCTEEGRAACEGGVCLHTAHERGSGYVCSSACESSAACPRDWRCLQVGPGASYCVPPSPPSLEPVIDPEPGPDAEGQEVLQ